VTRPDAPSNEERAEPALDDALEVLRANADMVAERERIRVHLSTSEIVETRRQSPQKITSEM
jgi:hypothetical protein